ncbi:unnamed protein product [Closterium sp. Naga37s-1]|nr:unnamed protein product [Closterium sp. Naga37s-1]
MPACSQVMLCAPMGRAAQRLEEATKRYALHPCVQRRVRAPLPSCTPPATLLHVLPSACLLWVCERGSRCGLEKVHGLTHIFRQAQQSHIFRQAQQSHIVQHAHAIRNASRPSFHSPWPPSPLPSPLASPPCLPPTTTTTTTTTTDADAPAPSVPRAALWRGTSGGPISPPTSPICLPIHSHSRSHATLPAPVPHALDRQARLHSDVLTRMLPHLTASPWDDVQEVLRWKEGRC